MKNNYDEAKVIRTLSKKASINIDTINKTIEIIKNNNDVGNSSWGKIDYLCKVHGYSYLIVGSFSFKQKRIINNDFQTKEKRTKTEKRELKLNMASMSKNAMKKVSNKK